MAGRLTSPPPLISPISKPTEAGGPVHFGASIHEFRGDKIARETICVAEGWEAPEWRKQWRAAP